MKNLKAWKKQIVKKYYVKKTKFKIWKSEKKTDFQARKSEKKSGFNMLEFEKHWKINVKKWKPIEGINKFQNLKKIRFQNQKSW